MADEPQEKNGRDEDDLGMKLDRSRAVIGATSRYRLQSDSWACLRKEKFAGSGLRFRDLRA